MLNDLRNTTKHSVIYALGNTATKIVGIILIPIYTDPQYLTQADYGILAILEAMGQILTGLFTLAMAMSLNRWYWDKDYEGKQKRIFFTSFAFLLGVNIPVFFLLSYYSEALSSLIFSSADYTYLIQLTVVAVGLRIANSQVFALLKLQSKSLYFSVLQLIKLGVTLTLTIWFIVGKGKGLDGIWEASLIGEMLTLLLLLPTIFRNIELKFDLKILREMFSYGYPLMLSSAAVTILTVTDRFMLKFLSGLEATAIYALGLRIANTLNLIVTASINSALAPVRMKKMNEPDNQRFYSKILLYTALLFTFLVLALSLFSLEILKVLTNSKEYWAASGIIPILAFSLLFTSMRFNANIGLVIKKKTKIIALLIFLASGVNLGLNYLLIPLLDIYGVSIATFMSQFLLFVGVAYASQRYYKIHYEWNKVMWMVVFGALLIGAGLLLTPITPFIRIPAKVFLLLLYPFLLFWVGFFETVEIKILKGIFKAWKNPRHLRKNIERLISE